MLELSPTHDSSVVINLKVPVSELALSPVMRAASTVAAEDAAAQTALDRIATAADRVQTGLDRVSTGNDRIQTGLDATTTTNQANIAAAHAAAAGSVVQQDLSGVTAAALHRSPNAIVAQFIYDTSKDSDGGAWVEKCQHLSWFNETLQTGAWRGPCASEAACRAISGAATGDYFQLTTDGKFYKLNAGAGTTEVFRGNKAKFPRLAAIGAEAQTVTIYDLTEPGRPMWMRFSGNGNSVVRGSLAAISILNGKLTLGHGGATALTFADFAADKAWLMTTFGIGRSRNIAQRNDTAAWVQDASTAVIVNNTVNAVAMTVLPDAPVDPVTGLQVPTVYVVTSGGISRIAHDGTVSSTALGVVPTSVTIDKGYVLASVNGSSGDVCGLPVSMALPAGGAGHLAGYWSTNIRYGRWVLGTWLPAVWPTVSIPTTIRQAGNVLGFGYAGTQTNGVAVLKHNPSTTLNAAVANITAAYNTGYMLGDIRRSLLADVSVGSVSGTELVTNGTFAANTTGWTAEGNVNVTWDAGGALSVQVVGSVYGHAYEDIPVTIGKSYRLTFNVVSAPAQGAYYRVDGGTATQVNGAPAGPKTFDTVATAATLRIRLGAFTVGDTVVYDNVSLQEVVLDRSYKNKPITVYGTLTKTAVAAAAQLVAFSNFSAANYLQEPYSADLDFGTGSWRAGAWVSYTAAVASVIAERRAAAGAYILLGTDATGKLTATAYDGTTTRTVTTAAAYNSGTFLSAHAIYTANGAASTLTIEVNGVTVATSGAIPAMLTMNNASAVFTVGQSRTLDAPFPGSICLVKPSATVPTAEQAVFMYEQEKQMFRAGAQVCLPDALAIADLTYDEALDKWVAVSASNESSWTGLVRTSAAAVPAGSYTKAVAQSGVKMLARITASPGIDVTIPSQNLREELVNRSIAAARLARLEETFNYDGVAGQVRFPLPAGYTAVDVQTAGLSKREGAAKDWTRSFDGFVETPTYAVAPGAAAWVRIKARRFA